MQASAATTHIHNDPIATVAVVFSAASAAPVATAVLGALHVPMMAKIQLSECRAVVSSLLQHRTRGNDELH